MAFEPDLLFDDSLSVGENCEQYVNFLKTNYGIRFHADSERMGISISMRKKMGDLTDKERDFIYYGRYGEEIDVNQNQNHDSVGNLDPVGGKALSTYYVADTHKPNQIQPKNTTKKHDQPNMFTMQWRQVK